MSYSVFLDGASEDNDEDLTNLFLATYKVIQAVMDKVRFREAYLDYRMFFF